MDFTKEKQPGKKVPGERGTQVRVCEEKFSGMYRTYAAEVRRYVRRKVRDREAAEDIVQEVFCIAWRRRTVFLQTPNPAGWLMNAAKYKILEYYKMDQNDDTFPWEELELLGDSRHQDYEIVELVMILRELLSRSEQEMLSGYVLLGGSFQDLARKRGISEQTLRVRLCRIKKKIRMYLEEIKKLS